MIGATMTPTGTPALARASTARNLCIGLAVRGSINLWSVLSSVVIERCTLAAFHVATVNSTLPLMPTALIASTRSAKVETGLPSTAVITSPKRRAARSMPLIPALSAGEPGTTSATTKPPPGHCALTCSPAMRTPMPGRGTAPSRIRRGTIQLTASTGTAKPMPEAVPWLERMAVLTPISRPAESNNGPPELPGLMAASV